MNREDAKDHPVRVVVVVPTYNESANIETLLRSLAALDSAPEAVVVDDSSPDGTADVVDKLRESIAGIHLVRRTAKRSFGGSYMDGFRYALALDPEFIIHMDADLSHPPEFIPEFLKAAEERDMVIGSRYLNGIRVMNWPISRLALSLFANKYVHALLGLPFDDCTSGYRCWRAEALREVMKDYVPANGYAFLVETAYRAHRRGRRIGEIPVVFVERTMGSSKMSKKTIFESALLPFKILIKEQIGKLLG